MLINASSVLSSMVVVLVFEFDVGHVTCCKDKAGDLVVLGVRV